MPHVDLEYPKEDYSTVNRLNSRASYALKTIHGIINTSPLVHVAFNAPGTEFPVVLPMIGQMGAWKRPSAGVGNVMDLYLHGYVASRLMKLARRPAGAGAGWAGFPVTACASLVDGLVLSLTPNSHSYNYRSAVLFGHAVVVDDADERLWAMRLVTESVVEGRWAASRTPPTDAELRSTAVLRVHIDQGSAKVRTGMPHDERADVEDETLLDRVWTGVVPVWQQFGPPLPGPYNRVDAVPGYLTEHCDVLNEMAQEYAVKATTIEVAPKTHDDD